MPLVGTNWRRRVGLALVAAFVALLLVWDWTWFKPLIQQHVRERSGRAVQFERLRVGLDRTLSPTIAFEGLRVQNAPWAAQRPFIVAGEVAFTLTWRSLWDDKLVVSRLRLVDADVDMERQADGLRNWRLTRPDDRGPGRIKILTLDALRSRIHVVHGGIGLTLDAAASPLAVAEALPRHADLPLTTAIVFSGEMKGRRFDGQAQTSRVLSFVDSGVPFGLRGSARAAGATLSAQGRVADLIALEQLDVDVQARAESGATLGAPLPLTLAVPAGGAAFDARVHKRDNDWTVTQLHARVGHSDASGELAVHHDPQAAQRSTLRATLTSERVDARELMRELAQTPGAASAPQGGGWPQRLRAADGTLDWRVARFDLPAITPVQNARVQARLAQGVLDVDRLSLAVAGGSATGHGRLDARGEALALTLAASASGLRLDVLGAAGVDWARSARLAGELDAQIVWQASGASWRALARSGSGTLAASLAHASIPAALDAKLALDGVGVVAALFKRGEQVPVRCSSVQIEFRNGKGVTRQLSVDTERVAVAGHGRVDLGEQRFEVVLTPHLHRSALFALQKSVQVAGRFDSPQVTLVERDERTPVAVCAPRG